MSKTLCHPKKYSTLKMIDGVRIVVWVFSCGPCELYGRLFRDVRKRDAAARLHGATT